jgi:hypothetical protein
VGPSLHNRNWINPANQPQGPMKTRISPTWFLALVLAASVAPLLAQDAAKSSPAVSSSQSPLARPAAAYQSPWFTQLCKLARAGIEDRVLVAFVDAAGTFNLRPEQIIQLRDLGVSGDLVNMILQHDSEIALGLRQVPASTVPDSSSELEKLLVAGKGGPAATAARPAVPAAPKAAGPQAPSLPANRPSPVAPATPSLPAAEVAIADAGAIEPTLAFAAPPAAAAPAELSPVRKPYPEQLTNPIIMVRAAGRAPNLVLIEGFSDSPGR